MGPLAIAGIQAGISALPMLFGENSIFSGKKRMATREREKVFQKSQNYQLPGEYTEALQSAIQQQNVGLPSAAIGLYNQSTARQQASQLGALRSRRSLLGGLSPIVQGGQDAALKLAGMQADALQQGRRYADQMRMKMGGIKQAEDMRKLEEGAQYRDVQRMEFDRSLSQSLAGIGSALAQGATNEGYFGMTPEERLKIKAIKKSR
jgi:hypothetical protein